MKSMTCMIFSSLFLLGCATIGSIEKNYAKINYSDGIKEEEAILIAKHNLINSDSKNSFRVITPRLENCQCVLKKDGRERKLGAWLVIFRSKPSLLFASDFLGLGDSEMRYFIDKNSGKIIASGAHAISGMSLYMQQLFESDSKVHCSGIRKNE
ncbi:MAG: hypothetical protein Q8Q08_10670 [Candidatus Omnitrophota bacterium]|nr:hypothetical protein [Candidatus Omnitrophota bacterium]MDZ4241501.1 hypothetical protein [Candidatus Omnitrophota bacterium]